MVQRVNFFHARFQPQRDSLSARNGGLFLLFLLFCLALGSVGLRHHLSNRQEALARQEKRVAETIVDFDFVPSNDLKACHTALERLGPDVWQTSPPIAPLLEMFATVHTPGIWLTGVKIAQPEAEVWVQGSVHARRSERFPGFVRMLSKQKGFSGYVLKSVQLEKENSHASQTVTNDPVVRSVGGLVTVPAEGKARILTFRMILGKKGGAQRKTDLTVRGKAGVSPPGKPGKRS